MQTTILKPQKNIEEKKPVNKTTTGLALGALALLAYSLSTSIKEVQEEPKELFKKDSLNIDIQELNNRFHTIKDSSIASSQKYITYSHLLKEIKKIDPSSIHSNLIFKIVDQFPKLVKRVPQEEFNQYRITLIDDTVIYLNNNFEIHNDKGPAVQYASGSYYHYLNGEAYSYVNWLKKVYSKPVTINHKSKLNISVTDIYAMYEPYSHGPINTSFNFVYSLPFVDKWYIRIFKDSHNDLLITMTNANGYTSSHKVCDYSDLVFAINNWWDPLGLQECPSEVHDIFRNFIPFNIFRVNNDSENKQFREEVSPRKSAQIKFIDLDIQEPKS